MRLRRFSQRLVDLNLPGDHMVTATDTSSISVIFLCRQNRSQDKLQ